MSLKQVNTALPDAAAIKKCPKWVINEEEKVIVFPRLILEIKTLHWISVLMKVLGAVTILLSGVSYSGVLDDFTPFMLLSGAAVYLFGISVSAIYRGAKKDIAARREEIKQAELKAERRRANQRKRK